MKNANPAKLTVQRGSELFDLQPGADLKPGDIIMNSGTEAASVGSVSKATGFPSQVAKLQPGASVKVVDKGGPTDEVLGLETRSGVVAIDDALAEAAEDADFTITPEVSTVDGLFGAVPFLGGFAAPLAGALGLAALANNNSDGDAAAADGNGGNGSPLGPIGDLLGGGGNGGTDAGVDSQLRNGVAGLSDSLGTGLEATPLAPAAALTDAMGDGFNQVADQLAAVSANDPAMMTQVLAGALGFTQPGEDNASSGLSGGVDALSAGLNDATAGTPLAGAVDPIGGLLGGDAQQLGGIASAVGDLASQLPSGDTPLAGVTDMLLTPVLGATPASTQTAGTDALFDGLNLGGTNPLSSAAGLTDALGGLQQVLMPA